MNRFDWLPISAQISFRDLIEFLIGWFFSLHFLFHDYKHHLFNNSEVEKYSLVLQSKYIIEIYWFKLKDHVCGFVYIIFLKQKYFCIWFSEEGINFMKILRLILLCVHPGFHSHSLPTHYKIDSSIKESILYLESHCF